ncbi:MAG: Holliday junction branch migration protein RuvA [Bacteroidia bacterium]|jgi:Holliday junction DNA helicase RuvA|nr:Holliday junction branch migration protein RuvA [Bacteroidia bacterium]
MIDYILGNIVELNPAFIVVESYGIGYRLFISLQSFQVFQNQKQTKVFVETMFVRDDMPRYYGFATKEERDIFKHLISVSGVGGSSAMLMLSSLSPSEIIGAINTANVSLLKSIKGIGEKTAQRIVVDLKGKLGKHEGGIGQIIHTASDKIKEDTLMALVALGFNKNQAEKAIEKSVLHNKEALSSVEVLLKMALKNLQ